MNEVIQIVSVLDGLNTKSNGQQTIKFKMAYAEIANYSKLLLLLGRPIRSMMINEDGEKIKIGQTMIDKISIDRDGEAKLSLLGTIEEIEMDRIPLAIEKVVTLKIKLQGGE